MLHILNLNAMVSSTSSVRNPNSILGGGGGGHQSTFEIKKLVWHILLTAE